MSVYLFFLNVIESILFALVTLAYVKVARQNWLKYCLIFIAGQTAIVTVTNLFLFYEGFYSLIYNAFFFFMMYWFRDENTGPSPSRIIIYVVLINIIVSICTELSLIVGINLFHFPNLAEFINSDRYLNIVFYTSRPFIALLLCLVNKVSAKYRSFTPKYISYYLFLFLGIYFLITHLETFIFASDYRWTLYIEINVLLGLLGFSAYHLFNLSAYDHFYYEEQMLLLDEMKVIKENMRMYEEEENKLLEIQHNIKNELTIIGGFIKTGEYEKSQKYIRDTVLKLNQLPVMISSDHPAIDMILSTKLSYAKSRGIEVTSSIKLGTISSDAEYDLALMIGHLLDNAIENISEKDPYISVRIHEDEDVVITVQNTTNKSDNSFKSTKQDQRAHGFGIKQIRMLAEKYKGSVSINIIDQKCTAMVILNGNL